MIESKICKHIIPFQFNASFEELVRILESAENQERFKLIEGLFLGKKRFHKHIIDNFQTGRENASLACKQYRINPRSSGDKHYYFDKSEARRGYLLLKGNKISDSDSKEEFKFNLNSFDLFVFQSGIGFLVVDYDMMTDDLEECVKTNYFLQALKSDAILHMDYYKKAGKDSFNLMEADISLLDILADTLREVDIDSFFEIGSICMIGDKTVCFPIEAFTFSALLLNGKQLSPEEKKYRLALLSNGYKNSYRLSNEIIEKGIIESFDNLMWSISREGVSNIAELSDEASSVNEFLTSSYNANSNQSTISTYFNIYILALSQRFALLNLLEKISSVLSMLNIQENHDSIREKLNLIRMKITTVTITNIYFDISNNDLYNSYYTKLLDTLGINKLIEEFEISLAGLESATEIINQEERRQQILRDEVKEKKVSRLTSIASVAVAISLTGDTSDLIKEILDSFNIGYSNIPIAPIAFVFLLCATAFGIVMTNKINSGGE